MKFLQLFLVIRRIFSGRNPSTKKGILDKQYDQDKGIVRERVMMPYPIVLQHLPNIL